MKVYKLIVITSADHIHTEVVEGELVRMNGVEWVQTGRNLTERCDQWMESPAAAISVAIPRMAKLHAVVEDLIGLMHEGKIR